MNRTEPMMKAQSVVERRQEILHGVRELLIGNLHVRRDPDEIDPDSPLFGTGLGLDSIDAVELVVCLERTFGIVLGDDKELRRKTRTVNSIIDTVVLATGEQRGA
jgi:acyl carrier protein